MFVSCDGCSFGVEGASAMGPGPWEALWFLMAGIDGILRNFGTACTIRRCLDKAED
jgi:hypothetical protein